MHVKSALESKVTLPGRVVGLRLLDGLMAGDIREILFKEGEAQLQCNPLRNLCATPIGQLVRNSNR